MKTRPTTIRLNTTSVAALIIGLVLGAGPAVAATFSVTSQKVAVFSSGVSVAPAVSATVSFPAANGLYNAAGFDAGCSTPTGDLCGTASASNGLSKVEVSIQREADGTYWNGSSFAGATEQLFVATGTSNWSYPFAAANFPGNGNYVVRALATASDGATGSSSNTFTIDVSAPGVAITFAANSGVYNAAGFDTGCSTAGGDFCGTASDTGSGLANVQVSIRQSGGNYWNGTAFGSATEQLFTATGTSSWSYGFAGSNFPATGSYVVRAVATDAAGNTTSASNTFTIDITPPTATITFPVANGFYNTAGFDAGCSTGTGDFCGSAADTGSSVASVKVAIRRSSTSNYWDGTGFTSSSEVLFTAIGATSWSYAFSGSSFPADGGYVLRVEPADAAGNKGSASSTFTIDNTPPSGADIQTTNGGVAGTVDQGDTVIFTFSEPVLPGTILAGWSGAAGTSVSVALSKGTGQGNDSMTVSSVNLGTVDLGQANYVSNSVSFTGSTMTMSGNSISIVLGTVSDTRRITTGQTSTGTMSWTPSSSATDRAGNGASTAVRTEASPLDREF